MFINDLALRNFLKLPKASNWLYYEWFYSDMDQVIFEKDNEFLSCLENSFPKLNTTKLNRMQWCRVRKLLGKPRRCSQAFFDEERASLKLKRDKIRIIWQLDYDKTLDVNTIPLVNSYLLQQNNNTSDTTNLSGGTSPSNTTQKLIENFFWSDLPAQVPHPPIVGSRVVARIRDPCDGMYRGRIIAIDHSKWEYRVDFDHFAVLGTQSVSDFEIASWKPQGDLDKLSISSVIKINRLLVSQNSMGAAVGFFGRDMPFGLANSQLNPLISPHLNVFTPSNLHNNTSQFPLSQKYQKCSPSYFLSPQNNTNKGSRLNNNYTPSLFPKTFMRRIVSPLPERIICSTDFVENSSIEMATKRLSPLVLAYPSTTKSSSLDNTKMDEDLQICSGKLPFSSSFINSTPLHIDDWKGLIKQNIELEKIAAQTQNETKKADSSTRLETLIRVSACYKLLMYKAKHIDSLKRINREAEKMQQHILPGQSFENVNSYPEDFKIRYAELVIKIKGIDNSLKILCEKISQYLDIIETETKKMHQQHLTQSQSPQQDKIEEPYHLKDKIDDNYYKEAKMIVKSVLENNNKTYPELATQAKSFFRMEEEMPKNSTNLLEKTNVEYNNNNNNLMHAMELISHYTALLLQLKKTPSAASNGEEGGQHKLINNHETLTSPILTNRLKLLCNRTAPNLEGNVVVSVEKLLGSVKQIGESCIDKENKTFFQENIEIHVNHLKNLIFDK